MSSIRSTEPIHIGLASDEPIRVEGLTSIFEQPSLNEKLRVVPVAGTIPELLNRAKLEYLVVSLAHDMSGVISR